MTRRSHSSSRSRSPARKYRRRHHSRERDPERDRDGQRVDRHNERDKDNESRRDRRGERDRHKDRDRERGKDRDNRDRSASPERRHSPNLLKDVKPLTESDYFQKSDEFRVWLKEDKRKYFDELSGEKARSYFRKFVKAWNKGKLPQKFYDGLAPGSVLASTNTSYKWNFASKLASQPGEDDALRAARVEVGKDTWSRDVHWKGGREEGDDGNGIGNGSGSRKIHGPTLPTPSDIVLASELVDSQREEERTYRHAKNKKETKDRIEDLVGPKPVGREGMLEKKALRREGDRAFREKGDEGLEVDEGTLMGGGDSFKAMIARRDMTKRKYEQRQDEKVTSMREKASAMKEKEKATMDMFQQLAKQRFG